jgi:crotonobetainyl-CoA:carnitine CoA-transferase CaiB-like acyl-CoA transferase
MVTTGRTGLEGIRLLEVASGFGPAWVGKLFADLGADVIRFESEDDRVRSRPHDVHRWINANKRSATSDLSGLAAGAGIVVHGLHPAVAADRGLGYEQLVAVAGSQLVVTSMTPFGTSGPYADFVAEELNLIHSSSWGFLSPAAATDESLPPLKAPGHHASILVANVAASVTLAAFDQAERTSVGDFVDFSSFAAAAKMTETAPAGASFQGNDASRLGSKTIEPWAIHQCVDGLVHILCVEPSDWEALIEIMGRPEWAELEVFATNEGRTENADLLHLYLGEWTATQHVVEIYRVGQAARIPITPLNTMPQIDADPQLDARGFFATTSDGLRVPGAGFQTDQGWWRQRSNAPSLGEHDGEGWRAPDRSLPTDIEPNAVREGSPTSARPLEGVRVCDFSWVWAGPFCTQYLAHLGADVIRLESADHPCLFRRLPFNPPEVPLGLDSAGVYQWYNSDKRSLEIDLGHPDAAEIVHRLVACSDVVIDNFGVGVMESLGFGVDALRAINPEVIVASLSGYGQTGPSASYMAYGPTGGAFSGLYAATGYEDGWLPGAEIVRLPASTLPWSRRSPARSAKSGWSISVRARHRPVGPTTIPSGLLTTVTRRQRRTVG